MFHASDIDSLLNKDFVLLSVEENCYMGKSSKFTLVYIDGLMLGVCKYTPLGWVLVYTATEKYHHSENRN